MASSSSSYPSQQQHPKLVDPIDEIAKSLALLPVRPCRGQRGYTVDLEANYYPLKIPSTLVIHRYRIEIVPPPKELLKKTSESTATKTIPPPLEPVKKTPKSKARKTIFSGAINTSAPGQERTLPIHPKASGQAGVAKDVAAPSGPSAPGGSPAPDDSSTRPVPIGKKAEHIIKLLLDLPSLRPYRNIIFTDFRANLFSGQELPKRLQDLKVQYRAENIAVARPNDLTYTVRLIENPRSINLAALKEKHQGGDLTQFQYDRQELIQVLNIFFLHYVRSSPHCLSIGGRRSFPSKDNDADQWWSIGGGLRAVRGSFSSVRVADSNILVNVNLSHGSFYNAGSLVTLIEDFSLRRPRADLEVFLRGLRVGMNHYKDSSGKTMRVKTIVRLARRDDGISASDKPPQNYHRPVVVRDFAGPKEVSFWYEEVDRRGRSITVSEYFQKQYALALNPGYPVLNVGSPKRPVYVGAEVCEVIYGQLYKRKLDAMQTRQMTEGAVRENYETKQFIHNIAFESVGLSESNQQLGTFHIEAKKTMTRVKGRCLGEPTLQYGNNQKVVPRDGTWNLYNKRYCEGKTLPAWSFLELNATGVSSPKVEAAMKSLFKTAKGNGLQFEEDDFEEQFNKGVEDKGALRIQGPDDPSLRGFLESCVTDYKKQLMVVVLPRKDTRLYQAIKRIGDVEVGLHTLCVLSSQLHRNEVAYYMNVAVKINLKLGGVNHQLLKATLSTINKTNTMVVGIDVTHPSPGSSGNCPSVAAMVASVDENLGQWPAIMRLQRATQLVPASGKSQRMELAPKQEIVSDIEEMLETRLDLWSSKNNKTLPGNILVYRDGVSEGQYKAVIEQEIGAIQQRCRQIYMPRKQDLPRITFIIVGKRHHTRFFHVAGNPKNGTVVDNGVIDDRKWDFFLQSHTPLQGTARPAHYVVLKNEIFTQNEVNASRGQYTNVADIVESVTHELCFVYGRCTRAISYCAPAYYADRACERARCYLSRYFDGSGLGNVEQRDIEVHKNLKDSMFYV
ncbi:MAG: hypothetical protein Q9195_007381 [Heterodermia aff. obscurata]